MIYETFYKYYMYFWCMKNIFTFGKRFNPYESYIVSLILKLLRHALRFLNPFARDLVKLILRRAP